MIRLIEFAGPILAYLAGWFWAMVLVIRDWNGRPHCREGYSASHCRRYHHPGCLGMRGIDGSDKATASAVALLWPVLAPVWLATKVALRKPRGVRLAEDIERMEREAGIR